MDIWQKDFFFNKSVGFYHEYFNMFELLLKLYKIHIKSYKIFNNKLLLYITKNAKLNYINYF